jgi:hypothetical protein
VAGFETTLGRIAEWRDLQRRIAGGERDRELDLFLLELDLGRLKLEEARARAAGFAMLTAEQKARIEQMLLDLEVHELLESVRSVERRNEVAKRCAEMAVAGKVPSGDLLTTFWSYVIQHAEGSKDVPLFEKGLAALKTALAGEERAARFLESLEKRLEELRRATAAGGGNANAG